MPDVFSAAVRSRMMSGIHSRWTGQERAIHGYLKGWKVRHCMHPKVPGKPDLIVGARLAVYLHGCFWHGCARCYVPPKSNEAYWHPKIHGNRARDRRNVAATRRAGYRVMKIWEHDYKRGPEECAQRIVRELHRIAGLSRPIRERIQR
jgi:DNA mismatch endonuclease Vsr